MLFTSRRFFPLFVTQFLGAFNDNFFKNALVMLVAFKIPAGGILSPSMMVIAAGALFMLPYFLFSATAGQISDKIDRARMARITKVWEIIVVLIGAVGFLGHYPMYLLVVLFMLGVQAAFFGPVKYALLPQHLSDDELVAGNAMIEAGSFLAILLGTIMGGILVMMEGGEIYIVASTLIIGLAGYVASRYIPLAPAPVPGLKIDFNIVRATWNIVKHDRTNKRVFRAILCISWFWVVGAVFLSQFPALVKDIVNGTEGVVTLFLAMFSVGIGVGSGLANALTHGKIDSKFVAPAALGMALFMADLTFACFAQHESGAPGGVMVFFSSFGHIRILFDLFMIALCGGIFVVPLYAIMQHDSDVNYRARTIATTNVINAFFMVLSAGISAALLAWGLLVPHLFAIMAAGSVGVAYGVMKLRRR